MAYFFHSPFIVSFLGNCPETKFTRVLANCIEKFAKVMYSNEDVNKVYFNLLSFSRVSSRRNNFLLAYACILYEEQTQIIACGKKKYQVQSTIQRD